MAGEVQTIRFLNEDGQTVAEGEVQHPDENLGLLSEGEAGTAKFFRVDGTTRTEITYSNADDLLRQLGSFGVEKYSWGQGKNFRPPLLFQDFELRFQSFHQLAKKGVAQIPVVIHLPKKAVDDLKARVAGKKDHPLKPLLDRATRNLKGPESQLVEYVSSDGNLDEISNHEHERFVDKITRRYGQEGFQFLLQANPGVDFGRVKAGFEQLDEKAVAKDGPGESETGTTDAGGAAATSDPASILSRMNWDNLLDSINGPLEMVRLLKSRILDLIAILFALLGGGDSDLFAILQDLEGAVSTFDASRTQLLASNRRLNIDERIAKLQELAIKHSRLASEAEVRYQKSKSEADSKAMIENREKAERINQLVQMLETLKRPLQILVDQSAQNAQDAKEGAKMTRSMQLRNRNSAWT